MDKKLNINININIKKLVELFGILVVLMACIAIPFAEIAWGASGLWIVAASIGSICGVISVYFCNKKNLLFALFGSIATVYMIWAAVSNQWIGTFVGQIFWFGIGAFNFLFWLRLIRQDGDSWLSGFATKTFKKENIKTLFLGYATLTLLIAYTSKVIGWNNGLLDGLQSAGFLFGALLMSIGNIWGFAFFIVADIIYLIMDFIAIIEGTFTPSIFIMHLAYTLLAIQGFILWKFNDFMKKPSKNIGECFNGSYYLAQYREKNEK